MSIFNRPVARKAYLHSSIQRLHTSVTRYPLLRPRYAFHCHGPRTTSISTTTTTTTTTPQPAPSLHNHRHHHHSPPPPPRFPPANTQPLTPLTWLIPPPLSFNPLLQISPHSTFSQPTDNSPHLIRFGGSCSPPFTTYPTLATLTRELTHPKVNTSQPPPPPKYYPPPPYHRHYGFLQDAISQSLSLRRELFRNTLYRYPTTTVLRSSRAGIRHPALVHDAGTD